MNNTRERPASRNVRITAPRACRPWIASHGREARNLKLVLGWLPEVGELPCADAPLVWADGAVEGEPPPDGDDADPTVGLSGVEGSRAVCCVVATRVAVADVA